MSHDNDKETMRDLGAEISELAAEISRLRVSRGKQTYRLEQAIKERDRLLHHLSSLTEDGAA